MSRFTDEEVRELGIDETLVDRLENEEYAIKFGKWLDVLLTIAKGMNELSGEKIELEELLQIAHSQYRQVC